MEENIEIKSTAKTTAERQRAYRERLKKRDVSRLDVIVSDQAHHALSCLALHGNVTTNSKNTSKARGTSRTVTSYREVFVRSSPRPTQPWISSLPWPPVREMRTPTPPLNERYIYMFFNRIILWHSCCFTADAEPSLGRSSNRGLSGLGVGPPL